MAKRLHFNDINNSHLRIALLTAARFLLLNYHTCNCVKDSMSDTMCVFESPSRMKAGVEKGYFIPLTEALPRKKAWYGLTRQGFYTVMEMIAYIPIEMIHKAIFNPKNPDNAVQVVELQNKKNLMKDFNQFYELKDPNANVGIMFFNLPVRV